MSDAEPRLPRSRVPGIDPPPEAAALVRDLYERGLFLQAWRAAEVIGPLAAWRGAANRVLAGRLANQLGDRHLAALLHLRARRAHPESEEAWLWMVRVVEDRNGPYPALAMLRRGGPATAPGAEAEALRAHLSARMRDFEEAELHLARAEEMAPGDPWILVERATVLELADDYPGALDAAERALARRPWYPPATTSAARLLVLLDREGEAVSLLGEAAARLESAWVALTLLELQEERGQHAEANATLDRLEQLLPLRTRALDAFLAGHRSDVAYHLGDREQALARARRAGDGFYRWLSDRLGRAGGGEGRVLLPVGFVRQHHMTCSPATLTALSRFHGVEAAHLEVAEAICYDGTPSHAERQWAADRGFRPREFTVTWEAALALLDRGLPFALATVEPGSAHLQAAVGYDGARGTLLLRDPFHRSLAELAERGLEHYRSTGPRGMVLVPPGGPDPLQGLELPEEPLHDLYHQAQAALVAHDRPRAAGACARLEALAPASRLSLMAARSLAHYDGDEEAGLAMTEALLALFPDDVNLRLSKQASLASLGRREARIEWLRAERRRAGHPLLSLVLADALREDARALPEAATLVRSTLQRMPYHAHAHHVLGLILQEQGDREAALGAHRAASCLEATDERYAASYFYACRLAGRTAEALDLLRGRLQRLARKAAWPAFTLFEALEALDRLPEALEVLEQALSLRPDDGPLLLFAARAHADAGDVERARGLLARVGETARRPDVLRTAAQIAERSGDRHRAAALWAEVATLEPLNPAAVQAAARGIADTQDRSAALADLRARVARFPHHRGLSHLLVQWLAPEPPAVIEAELRRLLAASPSDAWALRELALALTRQGRSGEALEALDRAAELDPSAPGLHNCRAHALLAAGRAEEAKEALEESLRLSVDGDWAIDELLRTSADAAERRRHLRFVYEQLVRQVTFGDGLLAYQRHAAGILEPGEMLEALREGHRARPDLWHAWVALARQLALTGQTAAARDLLEQASARFPMLPRVWLELAGVERARGDREAQRRALERALALDPGWAWGAQDLAALLHGQGEFEAERELLLRTARRAPGNAVLQGWLADACRSLGRREEAAEALGRALRLDPGYLWAWGALVELCGDMGRPEVPRALAEEIAAARPHDPRSWRLAAEAREALEERLAALDRALALDPDYLPAHERRVDLLAEAGRLEEALAAAAPPGMGSPAPRPLRLRAARVEAQLGRGAEAMRSLAALLEAEPDFLDGWKELAGWHHREGRHLDGLAAARRIAALDPHGATSHGFLGRALLAAGHRDEARAAFQRAAELDPGYTFGLLQLFSLQLEDGDLEGAGRTLALAEPHLGQAEAAERRAELEERRGRRGDRRARAGGGREPATRSWLLYLMAALLASALVRTCGG